MAYLPDPYAIAGLTGIPVQVLQSGDTARIGAYAQSQLASLRGADFSNPNVAVEYDALQQLLAGATTAVGPVQQAPVVVADAPTYQQPVLQRYIDAATGQGPPVVQPVAQPSGPTAPTTPGKGWLIAAALGGLLFWGRNRG